MGSRHIRGHTLLHIHAHMGHILKRIFFTVALYSVLPGDPTYPKLCQCTNILVYQKCQCIPAYPYIIFPKIFQCTLCINVPSIPNILRYSNVANVPQHTKCFLKFALFQCTKCTNISQHSKCGLFQHTQCTSVSHHTQHILTYSSVSHTYQHIPANPTYPDVFQHTFKLPRYPIYADIFQCNWKYPTISGCIPMYAA